MFRSFCLVAVLFLSVVAAPALAAESYMWIEGESPTEINVKPKIAGWGRKEFLSGGQWLHVSIDADKVEKETPADGALISHKFKTAKPGPHEIWNRIGYEFARSPFEWRVDGGEWKRVGPDELTTDLMELETWNEVAWLKLGEKNLAAGEHRLEIRLPRTKDEKGNIARILYASDALCISAGHFAPHSHYRPGENYRTAEDEAATKQLFDLPEPASPEGRSAVSLTGLWEITRHDEQLPKEVAEPIAELPKEPIWKGIHVPGDKNTLRPDLIFAHRVWYRTRVNVPKSQIGRSFSLTFPQNNLNTTVFVNGVYCGFNKNPFARFEIDVTKGVKAGPNEVWVGIRDGWYGYSTNPNDPLKLRKKFNLPITFTHMGFQDLAYPIWGAFQSGILVTPEFAVSGSVRAADVFVKPSVARHELAVDVTLVNNTSKEARGELRWQAVNPKTGAVEKTFAPAAFTLKPGAEQTLALKEGFENARLWWPDDPQLTLLRTSIVIDGKAVDTADTTFGFREWTSEGKDFLLNGIVWHGWADTHTHKTPQEWLDFYRTSNQRMMRFWGTSWIGLSPDAALEFFDKNGVVVRRSGNLDGEAIGYMAIENDPDLKKLHKSDVKMDLMQNWRDQVVAQVKGERNHPSVMLWSIENEWLFINCINLYGGLMDQFEAEVKKVSDAVRAADPTRLTMTDGGGANKDQAMPVHGNHYVFYENDTRYPQLAYETNPQGGGRGRWVWDEKHPRFLGEDYFANGINPADYAIFGGEAAFQGKAQARPAAGLIYRILTEGYRWAGFAAWHFWMDQHSAVGQYVSNSPRAVFCREWDWSFASGQSVARTLGLFNDSRSNDPISCTWSLEFDGRRLASKTTEHRVPAGHSEVFSVSIPLPKVEARSEGEFVLTLAVAGKEVFRDVKHVSVLPGGPGGSKAGGLALAAKQLLVYESNGAVREFLKGNGLPFTALDSLADIPTTGRVLIVGRDALDLVESTSSRLAAWASAGRTVIVLEQQNPLKFQGLPAEMEPAQNNRRSDFGELLDNTTGRIAYAEDLGHPVFAGLAQKDLFTWGSDEIVYRRAYVKPTRGGRSLVQCGPRLEHSALAEVPAGKGLLLLSQLAIGEKLESNAVARQLLANLIHYAAAYKLEYRQVAVSAKDDPSLEKTLATIGLQYAPVEDPLTTIAAGAGKLAIVSATPANLKRLAEASAKVSAFTDAGGYLVLHGLTPEGLADYNKLVGFDHMIRPFRRERVLFPPSRHPLASGLSTGDIVMLSGERIFPWTSDEYVASDIFTFVVDFDEVAPFAKLPSDYHYNIVNGFVSADAWKYIFSFDLNANPVPKYTMEFPKEQELIEMEWIGNAFYHLVTKLELTPDGNVDRAAKFVTKPNNEPQTFAIAPPLKGKNITLQITDWDKASAGGNVVGIDNLRLKARRSAEFYQRVRPLLNVGAIMDYPRGAGGILLCNLAFKDNESVPVNAVKKRTILATLLRNLKAPFSGEKTVIAGGRLKYEPIEIAKQATQYRDEKGWFGDKQFTFKDLPVGKQTLAGVVFQIYDFATSPVPTAIMLAGQGVPNNPPAEVRGIPVNRKADALFFLHTARIDQPRNDQERRENKKFETLRYVVTYADGATVAIPVFAEIDIGDYRQQTPAAIAGAQIAWTKPWQGTGFSAVAYSKQWNNPRPDVAIKSIDMVYGENPRGVPVLLAVTAASATE